MFLFDDLIVSEKGVKVFIEKTYLFHYNYNKFITKYTPILLYEQYKLKVLLKPALVHLLKL